MLRNWKTIREKQIQQEKRKEINKVWINSVNLKADSLEKKIPEDDNSMAIVLSIVFHEEQVAQKILNRVSDITTETYLKK